MTKCYNQFKTALLVWLQTVWHSFLGSLCWALPKHFRDNYVYFCEYTLESPSLPPHPCHSSSHVPKQIWEACIVFACLHVQVFASESACGVFVSRSERPAPVINGVPVWGTTRHRTQSLGQTATPPGLSFTWEEKGGKEGGRRGKFPLTVLYSLPPSLPPSVCPSIVLIFLQKLSTLYPLLFYPPLPYPLAPVLCSEHCGTFTCSPTRAQTPCEKYYLKNTHTKEGKKKGKIKSAGREKKKR